MPELGSIGRQARRHWKEHRPKMYKELQEAGTLKTVLLELEDRVAQQLEDLWKEGLNPDQAWEMVRDQVLLPSEEDQPELGGPFTWEKED